MKKPMPINEKTNDNDYPLLSAFSHDNIDLVKLIMDYANKNKIPFILNNKNSYGDYIVKWIAHYKNIEMAKLLKKYSIDYEGKIEFNESDIVDINFDEMRKNIYHNYRGDIIHILKDNKQLS